MADIAHPAGLVAAGLHPSPIGIADFVNIFNPEVVVVGGGFAEAGELLLESARKVVCERALPPAKDDVRVVRAELGSEAGLIGAALVAFDTLDEG